MPDTKACPFCRETIAAEAKKCRFCNEWLDGSGGLQLKWSGDTLLVPEKARLPLHACWMCATTESEIAPRSKKFVYTPPWVYFGLLAGPIPCAILALIMQKSATFGVPVCPDCKQRWFLSELTLGLFGFLGFFGVPAACGFLGYEIASDRDTGLGLGIAAGLVLWVGALIAIKYLYCQRVQPYSTYVENGVATLRVPNPRALQAVLEAKD